MKLAEALDKPTIMHPICIRLQSSYALPILVLVIALAIPLSGTWQRNLGPLDLMLSIALATFAGISFWLRCLDNQRWVEINAQLNSVAVHSTSLFFARKLTQYPLEIFGSVRSFATIDRPTVNRIELVTKGGGEALLIAALPLTGFVAIVDGAPTAAECSKARSIREQVASYAGLHDRGFLGPQAIGAQLG